MRAAADVIHAARGPSFFNRYTLGTLGSLTAGAVLWPFSLPLSILCLGAGVCYAGVGLFARRAENALLNVMTGASANRATDASVRANAIDAERELAALGIGTVGPARANQTTDLRANAIEAERLLAGLGGATGGPADPYATASPRGLIPVDQLEGPDISSPLDIGWSPELAGVAITRASPPEQPEEELSVRVHPAPEGRPRAESLARDAAGVVEHDAVEPAEREDAQPVERDDAEADQHVAERHEEPVAAAHDEEELEIPQDPRRRLRADAQEPMEGDREQPSDRVEPRFRRVDRGEPVEPVEPPADEQPSGRRFVVTRQA